MPLVSTRRHGIIRPLERIVIPFVRSFRSAVSLPRVTLILPIHGSLPPSSVHPFPVRLFLPLFVIVRAPARRYTALPYYEAGRQRITRRVPVSSPVSPRRCLFLHVRSRVSLFFVVDHPLPSRVAPLLIEPAARGI